MEHILFSSMTSEELVKFVKNNYLDVISKSDLIILVIQLAERLDEKL